ncbi:MAG: 2-oxoglutarate dehydrogenase complex dihydrolipoyllysine-residue succinyltransferase [Gammaproteobacteria bacterium]
MLVEVKVPMLAESVAEATLMIWHKKAGETVVRGDSLIDIETDKVTLDVTAPDNGVLVEIVKAAGEDVASNEVIAKIDTDATAGTVASATEPVAAQAAAPPAQQPSQPQQSQPQQQQPSLLTDDAATATDKLSPAVRVLLEEHNLDPATIRHSGDRITKLDVMAHLDRAATEPAAAPAPAPAPDGSIVRSEDPVPYHKTTPPPAPSAAQGRLEKRVPMTRLRQRTAERLLAAQRENAILTTFNEVNMQPVITLRQRHKEEFEKDHGVKLGFMSFFTSAAVEALKKFPLVNASIEGDDIVYHGYFDISIAVSSPKGLVVPVIRDADNLGFAEIETRIRDFGDRAQNGKLTMEELIGGTFTITNGGIFGSLLSTPILNPPQSAILGMHKIQPRPVVEDDTVVIRPMMYLALSYDHRIIDGREAVSFLVTIKELLEDPTRLLLQV